MSGDWVINGISKDCFDHTVDQMTKKIRKYLKTHISQHCQACQDADKYKEWGYQLQPAEECHRTPGNCKSTWAEKVEKHFENSISRIPSHLIVNAAKLESEIEFPIFIVIKRRLIKMGEN